MPTRKDNDLACKLRLGGAARERLVAQCAADAALLRSLNVMDYSLLLGIHHPDTPADPHDERSPRHRQPTPHALATPAPGAAGRRAGARARGHPYVYHSSDAHGGGGAVYYVCIIDLLQTWTVAKRLERLLKMSLCCRCGDAASGMSVVEPHHYAERFVRMIDRIVDSPRQEPVEQPPPLAGTPIAPAEDGEP
jgi:1-phosphatidylinositol-4-phosphate 5-kinase